MGFQFQLLTKKLYLPTSFGFKLVHISIALSGLIALPASTMCAIFPSRSTTNVVRFAKKF